MRKLVSAFLFSLLPFVCWSQEVAPPSDVAPANEVASFDEADSLNEAVPTVEIAPPSNVRAFDVPNDEGGEITVGWDISPDDALLSGYEIFRSESPYAGFELVGDVEKGDSTYKDEEVNDTTAYYYKMRAKTPASEYSLFSSISSPVTSSSEWYHTKKTNVLVGIVLFTFLIFWPIIEAKKGKSLFIRRIAGLDALDEAVGRATEMGKPLLYVPGISGMTDVATIASINILSQVAKTTAEYNTPIIVPNMNPIVMTVAQEVVKEAYLEKGRPEGYDPDKVFFLTSSQFAYAAGVCGIMMREKPATNLFMGWFRAESLLLAETGAMTGAIQIAGTDEVSQLPFFITACDYTIMGEELYAASAYLSKEPLLVGSLKGQDYNKLVLLGFIVIGSVLCLLGNMFVMNLLNVTT
jgi:hypothetical protein